MKADTDKLQNIVSKTLESWTETMAEIYYGSDYLKRFQEIADSIQKHEYTPEHWKDDTPFNKCKWFVYYDDGDEEFLEAFGSKKKALLYMNEVKRYEPTLIKGKVVNK